MSSRGGAARCCRTKLEPWLDVPKVLITGAGGFLGRHVVAAMAPSWDVLGAGRSPDPSIGCRWLRVPNEAPALADAVSQEIPDLVVHAALEPRRLADLSEVDYLARMQAVDQPLFRRCADHGVPMVLIGSSAVYGRGSGAKIDEEAPLRPVSAYGLAKAVQETLGRFAVERRGLELCILRLFNLVGPGQKPGTVIADWIEQLAGARDAELVLRVKTLDTRRDFVDVRDAADAVVRAAARPQLGESLNVASEQGISLDRVVAHLGALLAPRRLRVEVAETEPGRDDVRSQVGDAAKIRARLGWHPTIGWKTSVEDLLRQHFRDPAPSGAPEDSRARRYSFEN